MTEQRTLRSLWIFSAMARAWAMGRAGFRLKIHPATEALLVKECVYGAAQGDSSIYGVPADVDLRTPAGTLRLVYRGEDLDLPVDLRIPPPKHDPRGGICEVGARCWSCTWTYEPAEGTTPLDGLASAAYLAQEHRAATGHGVRVTAEVNYAARGGFTPRMEVSRVEPAIFDDTPEEEERDGRPTR